MTFIEDPCKLTGKLIHLAAKDDLRLNATILEGVVVKVLEDNGIAGSG